jgi:hypothetical protein
VTASLPTEVQQVFTSFVTTEYTTLDRRGQPVCWPARPSYHPGDPCIDVTAPGDPGSAHDARANPKVALLFSEPSGSGMNGPPQVLVQGTAAVGEDDVVHVRPERVYVWPRGDATREPQLFDAHMEEVRSGHDEEPEAPHAGAEGGSAMWDERIEELGDGDVAVLSLVAPDGFPFSVRVPISVDRSGECVRIGGGVIGVPAQAGLACLTASDRFQVRGDLVEKASGWVFVPHRTIDSPQESRDAD